MHEFQGTVKRGIDLGLRVAGASPPPLPSPSRTPGGKDLQSALQDAAELRELKMPSETGSVGRFSGSP